VVPLPCNTLHHMGQLQPTRSKSSRRCAQRKMHSYHEKKVSWTPVRQIFCYEDQKMPLLQSLYRNTRRSGDRHASLDLGRSRNDKKGQHWGLSNLKSAHPTSVAASMIFYTRYNPGSLTRQQLPFAMGIALSLPKVQLSQVPEWGHTPLMS
jgi:hypothetical protein